MTQIFIISGKSWTVPADWNSSDNTVETIGAGGGGQRANASYTGSGGGGGAYSKTTNLSLTAGSNITIQIGAGGTTGSAGGDTWFNGSTLATSSVAVKGGDGGADNARGAGGDAASGIGTVTYSGGKGGTNNVNPYGDDGWGSGYAGDGLPVDGAQGLLVVTVTPIAGAPVTAESSSALEAQGAARVGQPAGIEPNLTILCGSRPHSEAGGATRRGNAIKIGFANETSSGFGFSVEWMGAAAVIADAPTQLETGMRLSADRTALLEPASSVVRNAVVPCEWAAAHAVRAFPVVEHLSALPGLLLVSSERLLRSPGRVRILSSPSSVHPLRGQ